MHGIKILVWLKYKLLISRALLFERRLFHSELGQVQTSCIFKKSGGLRFAFVCGYDDTSTFDAPFLRGAMESRFHFDGPLPAVLILCFFDDAQLGDLLLSFYLVFLILLDSSLERIEFLQVLICKERLAVFHVRRPCLPPVDDVAEGKLLNVPSLRSADSVVDVPQQVCHSGDCFDAPSGGTLNMRVV